jgi:hypothetical protein
MDNLKALADQAPMPGLAREIQLGNISSGLTFSPSGAASVGNTIQDLPRWVNLYKSLVIQVIGTHTGTGAGAVAGTAAQYDFFNNISFNINGGQKFWNMRGMAAWALNLFLGLYRNSETPQGDTLIASDAAASHPYTLTLVLPFNDRSFDPRLFNLLNAYQNAGTTSFQLNLNMGTNANFATSDPTATLTVTSIKLSASLLDYSVVPDVGGEAFVRNTVWPRFEPNLSQSLSLNGTTNQNFDLSRGLRYRGLMLFDLDSTNKVANAGNITTVSVVRDTTDFILQGMNVAQYMRDIADRYQTNIFGGILNFVYFLDFLSEFHQKQMIDTARFAQWQAQVTSGTSGRTLDILELRHFVPPLPPSKIVGSVRR